MNKVIRNKDYHYYLSVIENPVSVPSENVNNVSVDIIDNIFAKPEIYIDGINQNMKGLNIVNYISHDQTKLLQIRKRTGETDSNISKIKDKLDRPDEIIKEFNKIEKIDNLRNPEYESKIYKGFVDASKNRYVDILPIDATRVKLHPDNGYINANYINGLLDTFTDRKFIATQAPIDNTIEDFWKMVSQQNITFIVMLTDLTEGGRKKATQYWPNQGEIKDAGFLQIQSTFEIVLPLFPDIVIRQFKIYHVCMHCEGKTKAAWECKTKARCGYMCDIHKTERHVEKTPSWQHVVNPFVPQTVLHVQWKTWPDRGSPSAKQLKDVDLLISIFSIFHNKSDYSLIHCSAGVGRTGTFIALMALIDYINKNKKSVNDGTLELNIYDLVRILRSNRPLMVQSDVQYEFIYRYIYHFITEKVKDSKEIKDAIGLIRQADTTKSIINFYLNIEPSVTGYMFEDIIYNWDDDTLEKTHDYIQYLFPLQEKSKYNKKDILLTEDDIKIFKTNKKIRENVREALHRMLFFYGISDFVFDGERKHWMTPNNHNHLRLTRIMKFLQLIGMNIDSIKLFILLCNIHTKIKDSISDETYAIWKDLFMKFIVKGNVFVKKNQIGDFNWMIKQPEYKDVLFIFNDNIESMNTCSKGGGNAGIRVYNQYNKKLDIPRSAGIPTGSLRNGGFKTLTETSKAYIDESINKIKRIIKKYNYKKIIFSKSKNGEFGSDIFTIGSDVKEYILHQLNKLTISIV